MWSCIVCSKPVSVTITCDLCSAVVYCSKQCLTADSQKNDSYAHNLWCGKMAEYMDHQYQLTDLPFTYTAETTSESFSPHKYRSFLCQLGVYNSGLWRRESAATSMCGQEPSAYGDLASVADSSDNPYILADGECLLQKPNEIGYPTDWKSYYSMRKIPLNSPLAILLTHALTVYYIILTHYNHSMFHIPNILYVDLLGVEREVDLLPTFKEVANLLPDVRLHLRMFGDKISPRAHGRVWEYEKMTVHVYRGLYHMVSAGHLPHLAIGLNAGLVAYSGWCKSLRKLKEQRTPAYFSDFCEYSADLSQLPVTSLDIGSLSSVRINPFRSPVIVHSPAHHMPTFSNAFLFNLVYSSEADSRAVGIPDS